MSQHSDPKGNESVAMSPVSSWASNGTQRPNVPQLISTCELEAAESVCLRDCIRSKHPHREDSSEKPPSSSLTLQKRTPLTKGTDESSSSSKSTLNLNFFFFIIIKSINRFSTLEGMLRRRPSLTLQPRCVVVLMLCFVTGCWSCSWQYAHSETN